MLVSPRFQVNRIARGAMSEQELVSKMAAAVVYVFNVSENEHANGTAHMEQCCALLFTKLASPPYVSPSFVGALPRRSCYIRPHAAVFLFYIFSLFTLLNIVATTCYESGLCSFAASQIRKGRDECAFGCFLPGRQQPWKASPGLVMVCLLVPLGVR